MQRGSPQVVPLTGTGTAPLAFVTPSSLTFTSQNVGTSGAQTVTLSNTGNASLTFSITLTGANSGDYSQTYACGGSVAAGNSCIINVTFTPAAPGTRTATLTITDNSNNVTGSRQSVSLTGTGIGPTVSLSPSTTLPFGTQAQGTSSTPQSITLMNTGNAALSISSIQITGTNASDFGGPSPSNTCGSSVAANGGTCTISVTFTPSTSLPVGTNETATVTITDNNNNVAGSQQSVSLTGTATGPGVSLSPSSPDFHDNSKCGHNEFRAEQHSDQHGDHNFDDHEHFGDRHQSRRACAGGRSLASSISRRGVSSGKALARVWSESPEAGKREQA